MCGRDRDCDNEQVVHVKRRVAVFQLQGPGLGDPVEIPAVGILQSSNCSARAAVCGGLRCGLYLPGEAKGSVAELARVERIEVFITHLGSSTSECLRKRPCWSIGRA